MTFELPPLPYSFDALEPYMGASAVGLHYDVLHRGYIEKVNRLLPQDWHADDLLDVIARAEQEEMTELLQAALQAWNHEFFWHSMQPPTQIASEAWGSLKLLVDKHFGSMKALRKEFVDAGVKQFASGWVWLSLTPDKYLFVEATPNADNPIMRNHFPLLVCDVWEHAYYINYGPDRAHYLTTWFDKLANFDFAAEHTRRVLQVLP